MAPLLGCRQNILAYSIHHLEVRQDWQARKGPGGGLEDIFPHNESEIAQSEAAFGQGFARYWILNNMVTVDGVKMGKSLGNFTAVKDALSRHAPMTLRFFILSSAYRSTTDFTEDALGSAARGYERLIGAVKLTRDKLAAAQSEGQADQAFMGVIRRHEERFLAALDDDFNTPQWRRPGCSAPRPARRC